MRALEVGIGARTVLRGRGRVLAVYRKAVYLHFEAGLLALTGSEVPPGPIHVRCPVRPAVSVGDTVVVTEQGQTLMAGQARIGLDVPTWSGGLPEADELRSGRVVALAALERVPPARLLAGDVPAVWPSLADDLRSGDLAAAVRVLAGRGPGLTPAGDDVLAGLLLVAAALGIDGPPASTLTSEIVAAASARTNEIAAAFLYWAARGQGIAPAHELLDATAGWDRARADAAVQRLLRIGASSGADLCYGLALGLRHLTAVAPSHAKWSVLARHEGVRTGHPA
jgi:uncharacterized protein DUF2877